MNVPELAEFTPMELYAGAVAAHNKGNHYSAGLAAFELLGRLMARPRHVYDLPESGLPNIIEILKRSQAENASTNPN